MPIATCCERQRGRASPLPVSPLWRNARAGSAPPALALPLIRGRERVQPQWVYDSINARELLASAPYAVGAVLPPHLSPFVEESEGDYVPPERIQQLRDQGRADNLWVICDIIKNH